MSEIVTREWQCFGDKYSFMSSLGYLEDRRLILATKQVKAFIFGMKDGQEEGTLLCREWIVVSCFVI